MKFLASLALYSMALVAYAQKPEIQRIDPTNWYVGMKNPHLQLMVYGKNIATSQVKLKRYAGVKIVGTQRSDNADYLFVNLDITKKAKAGNLELSFHNGTTNIVRTYRLDNRTAKPEHVNQSDFIYLLMPDRFANGDPSNDKFDDMADPNHNRANPFMRHGGDIQGVTQHLDYFKELGVTTLWLNPVVENNQPLTNENGTMRSAYHGYGFTDHYAVDKRFGGNDAYKTLVAEAHKKGLKVIQDAVYNHIGQNHWWMKSPPTKDWLNNWDAYQNTSYKDQALLDPNASPLERKIAVDGWFVPFLPDINTKNPLLATYLIQNALWCVEYFGIDAWRVDTYFYNDLNFMNACNQALYDEYGDMFITAESWTRSVPNQAYFVRNNIKSDFSSNCSSAIDFMLQGAIHASLKENFGWDEGVNRVHQVLGQDYLYQQPERNLIFLDNHDTDRFYSIVGEDIKKYKMGLTFLLTTRGVPQIYYGTELGTKNFKNPTDAEVRKDFEGGWADDKINKFAASDRTQQENEIFNHIKTLANYRKNSDALANGKLMQFTPKDGVYAYFRYTEKQTVMCVWNSNQTDTPVNTKHFSEMLKGATTAKNVMDGTELTLSNLSIPALSIQVLEINPNGKHAVSLR